MTLHLALIDALRSIQSIVQRRLLLHGAGETEHSRVGANLEGGESNIRNCNRGAAADELLVDEMTHAQDVGAEGSTCGDIVGGLGTVGDDLGDRRKCAWRIPCYSSCT